MMQRCLDLALMAVGDVAPNPMVGAVIVHEGKVIGEGFHQTYGGAHAEVNALENVPQALRHLLPQSELFVSLEPCNHYGQTPPCTKSILQAGIKKVTIACQDPFAQVNGAGIATLKNAGVDVSTGILEKEARWLNRRFFTFHQKNRPYIILKWAQTADGFIAPKDGRRQKISNEISHRLTHVWRTQEAAILVGSRTAINDNPQLNVRLMKGKDPLRVLWDKGLKVPPTHHLLSDPLPTTILNSLVEEQRGCKEYKSVQEEDYVQDTMQLLVEKRITSLIVEGGSQVLQSFLEAGLWDECRVFSAPHSFGMGISAPKLSAAVYASEEYLGTDRLSIFVNARHEWMSHPPTNYLAPL